jgi:predicted DNA-binding protein
MTNTTASPSPERVQVGWRISIELKRRLDIEAAKRQLVPARVVEEMLDVMLEKVDPKHHACASLEEARKKECDICLSRLP